MNRVSYNEFISNIDFKKVAIYGLSTRAKACLDWLYKHFPKIEIVGFIADSKTNLQMINKKPIVSLDYIKQNPDITVIYAERDIFNIEKLKAEYDIGNPFFIYYYVNPYLDTRDISYPDEEIRALYDPEDEETVLFLDNFFLAKSFDWSLLLPIDRINWVARYNKLYWDKTDNNLGAYDDLTLLDCGAYTGDSLEDFQKQYEKAFRFAYALEADKTKLASIEKTVTSLGLSNQISIIMKGVSNDAGEYFVENVGTTSGKIAKDGEQTVQTVRIDNLNIQSIGKLCIKMDIEGFEMHALKGAAETIKNYLPEMAICIYHQTADIFEIPAYIKSLCPEYKFIIRGGVHTVCYCSTKRFS